MNRDIKKLFVVGWRAGGEGWVGGTAVHYEAIAEEDEEYKS